MRKTKPARSTSKIEEKENRGRVAGSSEVSRFRTDPPFSHAKDVYTCAELQPAQGL
jgi:hypothetical protein